MVPTQLASQFKDIFPHQNAKLGAPFCHIFAIFALFQHLWGNKFINSGINFLSNTNF
jgi:hypothetical protein